MGAVRLAGVNSEILLTDSSPRVQLAGINGEILLYDAGLAPSGIASEEAFGTTHLIPEGFTFQVPSIAAPETAIGQPELVVQTEAIRVQGIPSAEDLDVGRIVVRREIFLVTPPYVLEKPAALEPPFNRVDLKRGVTVYKRDGEYHQIRYPLDDELNDADEVYFGGREYSVDAAKAAELEAQGFTLRTDTEIQ